MRLGCSRRSGRDLVQLGQAFEGPLAWTGDALASGHIDLVKAKVLFTGLRNTTLGTALDVQDAVLDGATRRTPTQLASDIQRELIRVEPQDATKRHDYARSQRRVCRPRVLPDGMAGIWAVLSAENALLVDADLDARARSLRTGGDSRTLDQLRADLLVATLEEHAPQPLAQAPPEVSDTTRLLDRKARAYQRLPAVPHRRSKVASGPGVEAPGPGVTAPGFETGDQPPAELASEGARERRRAARTQIHVTVPFSTLMGLNDDPAELAGYGAISADMARKLAAEGTWRRIVTDPLTDAVLDVGRTRYKPPADLAAHVRARDRVCARPGCSARASTCDLDHTIEYVRHDGDTAHTNLGPLCPRDHQIKTDGGFQVTQPEPGVFDWLTPTGHRYRIRPGNAGRWEQLSRSPGTGPSVTGPPDPPEVGPRCRDFDGESHAWGDPPF